ncbi:hypothetical protein, partial [Alteromonas stellipolaris]|uniref:hypothetical protein n=1 Tax=Alteromonas stellipolaris TaxID=233316 RepID=UPI001DE44055
MNLKNDYRELQIGKNYKNYRELKEIFSLIHKRKENTSFSARDLEKCAGRSPISARSLCPVAHTNNFVEEAGVELLLT